MVAYDDKFQQKVYEYYKNVTDVKTAVAHKFGISRSTVRRIVARMDKETPQNITAGVNLNNPLLEDVKASEGEYEYEEEFTPPVVEEAPQYIVTKNTIMIGNGEEVDCIDESHKNFQAIKDALSEKDWKTARSLINVKRAITEFISDSGNVEISNNSFVYKGKAYSTTIANRILEHMHQGHSPAPLVAFFERMMKNPSYRAVNELFGFIDVCSLPITDDGYFLAYKKVRANYTDCHSGKFDNSVGQIVEMERNQVNENQHQTCSAGLHFCSKGYLGHFGGDRVMVLKIDPADVVSIPTDYNNSKGRCCKYEVIHELKEGEEIPDYVVTVDYAKV